MDCCIELIFVPVTDVDRAVELYVEKVGFTLDIDTRVDDSTRFVQITPPGSACSIALGEGITDMAPGSQHSIQVVVDDAETAYTDLMARGVDATAVQVLPWGSFTGFSDPDGNRWAVQELPSPGSYDHLPEPEVGSR